MPTQYTTVLRLRMLPEDYATVKAKAEAYNQTVIRQRGGLSADARVFVTPHSPQQLHQILRPKMRVTLEHLQGLVPSDGRCLHRVQPLFKKSAGGLMAQVMETQVLNARPLAGTYNG